MSSSGDPAPVTIVTLTTPEPFSFTASLGYRVNVALDDANPFDFQLEVLGSEDRLDVRDVDLSPELSESLKLLLGGWTERHLGALLAELEQKTHGALKSLS